MKLYKVNLDLTAYIFADNQGDAHDRIGEYLKTLRKESEDFSIDDVCICEVENDSVVKETPTQPLNNRGFVVGQQVNIFIDNRDQIAVIDEIHENFMLVTINNPHGTDSFAIELCKFCKGRGWIMIHGREDTPEDCPTCNGWMFTRCE